MHKNHQHIKQGGTQKQGTISKENTVPPRKIKNLGIKPGPWVREKHLDGEFKKIKPTSFDGESRIGEEEEACLLVIKM